VRTQETNLADLVADSMRFGAGTDLAIVNGGGVRTSIPIGPITIKDAYNVMPFQNDVVTMTVTGENIYQAMEYSYAHAGAPFGGFVQVSGMVVTYDMSKEAGSRVVSITVNGEEMDRTATYTLATLAFIASGGDGNKAFVGIPTQTVGLDVEAFAVYLIKNSPIDDSKIQGGRLVSV
jgi:5'-nucleotidase